MGTTKSLNMKVIIGIALPAMVITLFQHDNILDDVVFVFRRPSVTVKCSVLNGVFSATDQ